MKIDRHSLKLLLDAAGELDMNYDVIDSKSGCYVIRHDNKTLHITFGQPAINDYVSTENQSPLSVYLKSLLSQNIQTQTWYWYSLSTHKKVNAEIPNFNSILADQEKVMLTLPQSKFVRVIDTVRLPEWLDKMALKEIPTIGLMPLYSLTYQVLMLGKQVLDIVSTTALSVHGDGVNSITQIINKQLKQDASMNIDPSISNLIEFEKDCIPEFGEMLFIENPKMLYSGTIMRIDLSNITQTDFSFFEQASIASRLQFGILNLCKTPSGQWAVQSIFSLKKVRNFTKATPTDPTFPFKQLLSAYFRQAKWSNSKNLTPQPTHQITDNHITPPDVILSLKTAAEKLNLSAMNFGEYGKLLRIENDRDSIEFSIRFTQTPRLSCNKTSVTHFKDITSRILHRFNIPVPAFQLFKEASQDENFSSIMSYAQSRFPVVIKPHNGSENRGVTTNIQTDEQCSRAIHLALKEDTNILVEEQLHSDLDLAKGGDYRVHVMRGEVIQVLNRIQAYVEGDGIRTIRDLIEQYLYHYDSRGIKQYSQISFDEDGLTAEILSQQGVHFNTILPIKQKVKLLQFGGPYHGGKSEDVNLDSIHPDNIEMFSRATAILGLEWAGIDFISPDITRSYKDIRCGINEVNSKPDFSAPLEVNNQFCHKILAAYFKSAYKKGYNVIS